MKNKNKFTSNAPKNNKNTDFVSANMGFGSMNTSSVYADFIPENTNSASTDTDVTHANTDEPMSIALSLAKQYSSVGTKTDPFGMWTGVPEEDGEMPVQDADDL